MIIVKIIIKFLFFLLINSTLRILKNLKIKIEPNPIKNEFIKNKYKEEKKQKN